LSSRPIIIGLAQKQLAWAQQQNEQGYRDSPIETKQHDFYRWLINTVKNK
jgi:hypothetical protein